MHGTFCIKITHGTFCIKITIRFLYRSAVPRNYIFNSQVPKFSWQAKILTWFQMREIRSYQSATLLSYWMHKMYFPCQVPTLNREQICDLALTKIHHVSFHTTSWNAYYQKICYVIYIYLCCFLVKLYTIQGVVWTMLLLFNLQQIISPFFPSFFPSFLSFFIYSTDNLLILTYLTSSKS